MGAGAATNEHWMEGWSYDDLFSVKNWVKAVKDMMQIQYNAGNMQGYLDYKRFLDSIDDDRKERANRKEQIEKANKEESEKIKKEEESKTHSEIDVKPDGSQVLVTTTTIGETQVTMSLEIAKPTRPS